jgi:hypothetical protein
MGATEAAERQKICSTWREPWVNKNNANQPCRGETLVDPMSSFALRLSLTPQPYPRLTPWATDLLPLRGCADYLLPCAIFAASGN